jgi:hypothetical protein
MRGEVFHVKHPSGTREGAISDRLAGERSDGGMT